MEEQGADEAQVIPMFILAQILPRWYSETVSSSTTPLMGRVLYQVYCSKCMSYSFHVRQEPVVEIKSWKGQMAS